jgi:N-acetylmuramic acid 6-phosphate (MurNAc-6-P) etherase
MWACTLPVAVEAVVGIVDGGDRQSDQSEEKNEDHAEPQGQFSS